MFSWYRRTTVVPGYFFLNSAMVLIISITSGLSLHNYQQQNCTQLYSFRQQLWRKPFRINLNSFVDVVALKTKATKNRKWFVARRLILVTDIAGSDGNPGYFRLENWWNNWIKSQSHCSAFLLFARIHDLSVLFFTTARILKPITKDKVPCR